jgi:Zn-dependent M28 family amino/carboxypeptidase
MGHDRPNAPQEEDWTYRADHAPFHAVAVPFVYFGVEDHPDYHRPSDDVDKIDPRQFVDSVRTILMGIRLLDAALPLEPASPR